MRQINPSKYKIGDIIQIVDVNRTLKREFAEIDAIIKSINVESPDNIYYYEYVLSIDDSEGHPIIVSEDDISRYIIFEKCGVNHLTKELMIPEE